MAKSLRAVCFALFFGLAIFAGPPAGAAGRAAAVPADLPAGASAKPAIWTNLGYNATHTGYVADHKLSTANAGKLGVNWMTRLYFADIGSPIVAYSTKLKANVVYVGDENGDEFAINEATGKQIWSVNFAAGDALRATPLYVSADNSLWVDTVYDQTMRKLDASTGKQLCSFQTIYNVLSSPIYSVLPSGTPAVFFGVQDGAKNGPEIALNETNCGLIYAFDQLRSPPAGSWDSPAYGLLSTGEPALVFATADPDSTVYAIDAAAGTLLWEYNVYNPPNQHGGYDVGAAPTLTAPGVNGFADGVVYVPSKYGYLYAFDLATGSVLWQYDEYNGCNCTRDDIAGLALDGNTMVGGNLNGAFAVNATTGAQLWQSSTTAEVESTPNIIGPPGSEIVSFADLSGKFYAVNLAAGKQLYTYQTGGYITASPAEADGHLVLVSTDGFLYDFAPGGGNVAPPTSAVSFPSQGASLPNPNGSLTLQGSATDANSVTAVQIGIQSGGRGGPWWNAVSGKWQNGPVSNPATLQSPKAPSTTWSLSFPVPAAGGPYEVFASAVNSGHQADRTGAVSNFSVQPSASSPNIAASPAYMAPGGSTTVSGAGFGPAETVNFSLNGSVIGSATTNGSGAIPPTALTVPSKATLGPTTISATGKSSGLSAVTPFTVGNSWTQSGGSSSPTYFEPNDPILAHVLHVGPGLFISPAYYFNFTSPSHSSPAVANGIAYVGNGTGLLTAVTVTTGAPAWTYQTNSSANITSTPGIDNGTVYFGSSDGNAYALNAANGNLISTLPIGGNVSSPAIGGGYVVFTSTNGSVVVISEASGKVVESLNLGVAIHSSPTLDLAINAVIVGTDSGAIAAIGLTNGNTIWTQSTGAAVDAPASISGGVVYIGSTSGTFYALNAKTGAVNWSYSSGSAIRTGAIVGFQTQGGVGFGNDGGNFYTFTTSGQPLWQQQVNAPVAGVSGAQDTIMINTTDGTVWALRPAENGLILMHYQTGYPLSTVPATNNGAVYVSSQAGGLYAFTPYGYLPFSKHRGYLRLPSAPSKAQPASLNSAAFGASGVRDYPIHFDWPRQVRSAPLRLLAHGGPVQPATRTYAIFWAPPGSVSSPRYVPGVEKYLANAGGSQWYGSAAGYTGSNGVTRNASRFSGVSFDRTVYPPSLNDASVQQVVSRAILLNGWRPGIDAQFLVFTGRGAVAAAAGFCSYHSAFNVAHNPQQPAVYALIPDFGPVNGCGASFTMPSTGDFELDAALSNIAHEQIEMATDPLITGWFDGTGREAGDGTPAAPSAGSGVRR